MVKELTKNMKNINNYIVEKLKINKSNFKKGTEYTLFPKDKEELFPMINKEISKNGYKCSLNHIDVSEINDLSYLFSKDSENGYGLYKFNGDISEWDVGNVEDMSYMFYESDFNGDISEWDVSNVEDMSYMFYESDFNGDISEWDVSNVEDMGGMFDSSAFNQDISNWDVSNVTDMSCMFIYKSSYNHDLSKWKINPNCYTLRMFGNTYISQNHRPLKNGKIIK